MSDHEQNYEYGEQEAFSDDDEQLNADNNESEEEEIDLMQTKNKNRIIVDSSEEEDAEDSDEERRVKEGFIVDDDDDDAPRRRKRKHKHGKHRERTESDDGEGLDEDDLDLLEENTGVKLKRTKLKRHRQPDTAASDDEQDHMDDLRNIFDEDEEEFYSDDEMHGFIEDDADTREPRERQPRKSRAFNLSMIKGLDSDTIQEVTEVFGDGMDYEFALEEDPAEKKIKSLKEIFEPSEIKSRMLSEFDDYLRATDIPERLLVMANDMGVEQSVLAERRPLVEEAMLDRMTDWVSTQISQRCTDMFIIPVAQAAEGVEGSETELYSAFMSSLKHVLRFMNIQFLEPMHIFTFRSDYLVFESSAGEETILLTMSELWHIWDLSVTYHLLLKRRAELADTYACLDLPTPDVYFEENILHDLSSSTEVNDAVDYLKLKYPDAMRRAAGERTEKTHIQPIRHAVTDSARQYNALIRTSAARAAALAAPSAATFAEAYVNGQPFSFVDPSEDPETFAASFADASEPAIATGARVLSAVETILRHELAHDPLLVKTLRIAVHDIAVLSVTPTATGLTQIDATHPYNAFKFLTDKPLKEMVQSAMFLQILAAKKEGLVTFDVHVPQAALDILVHDMGRKYGGASEDDDEENADRVKDEVKDEASHVILWRRLRQNVVRTALERNLLPHLLDYNANALQEQAEDFVFSRCYERLLLRANAAPYSRPDVVLEAGEALSVLAVTHGNGDPRRDSIHGVFLDAEGIVREEFVLDALVLSRYDVMNNNMEALERVDAQCTEYRSFLKRRRPQVIVVGGFSARTHDLMTRLKELSDDVSSELFEEENGGRGDYIVHKIWVYPDEAGEDSKAGVTAAGGWGGGEASGWGNNGGEASTWGDNGGETSAWGSNQDESAWNEPEPEKISPALGAWANDRPIAAVASETDAPAGWAASNWGAKQDESSAWNEAEEPNPHAPVPEAKSENEPSDTWGAPAPTSPSAGNAAPAANPAAEARETPAAPSADAPRKDGKVLREIRLSDTLKFHNIYTYDDVARLYQASSRSEAEFRDRSSLVRYCIGLARYVQSPVNEFAALTRDELCSLTLYPQQKLISDEKVLKAFERVLVEVVGRIGVDINHACRDPYYAKLLAYTPGLGLRKADGLLKNIASFDNRRVVCRAALLLAQSITKKVYENAAGFIRIPQNEDDILGNYDAEEEWERPEVLDSMRIHPDDYFIARKIAADAMDYDEEDLQGLAIPSQPVLDVFQNEKYMKRLNALSLDEFATELGRLLSVPKRLSLFAIRNELNAPFKELRHAFICPNAKEVFRQLTGETPATLDEGLIVSVRVIKTSATDPTLVRLDCGIEGEIAPEYRASEENGRLYGGQTVQALVLSIDYEAFRAQLSTQEDEIAKGDAERRRVAPDAKSDPSRGVAAARAEKETTGTRATDVFAKNPSFFNYSAGQAEQFLANRPAGTCVFRPSSRENHVALTWKVADDIYQHVALVVTGTGVALGALVFADLDEVKHAYVRPLMRKVTEMVHHPKFRPTQAELDTMLNNHVLANPGAAAYGFTFNSNVASGYLFNVSFKTNAQHAVQSWPVRVSPSAFELFGDIQLDMPHLCNAFKIAYAHRAGGLLQFGAGRGGQTGAGRGGFTGRTPGYGGRTGHVAGRTPALGKTPVAMGGRTGRMHIPGMTPGKTPRP